MDRDQDSTYMYAGQATLFVDELTGDVESGPEYVPGTPTGIRVDGMTPVRSS